MDEIKIEGNIDINQALKEFEIKSDAEQVQKAPEVFKTSDVPKMVQLVMKWSGGAIKEQKTAEYVLLGFCLLFIVSAIFIFFSSSSFFSTSQKPTATMIEEMKKSIPNSFK